MTNLKFIAHQRGAALIVTLMMLVVMTILAVNAVTTTTMEEKMAGNIRNKHMSFQAAEAALRAGEKAADAIMIGNPFDGTDGIYAASVPSDTNFPIWEWRGTPQVNWQSIASSIGTVKLPEYIIEQHGTSYRDSSCPLIVPLPPDCEVPVYRITARGTGLNFVGISMIQSTYK